MNAVMDNQKHRKLDLHEILTWMEQDGLVDKDNAHMLRTIAIGAEYSKKHPLQIIADRNWKHPQHAKLLSLDVLTEWFARRVDLPYVRIDPLKIDVAAVTDVMSYAYAARFNVLPIKVNDTTITVAAAQPYDREWMDELSRIHRKEFKIVISNPADVSHYLLEFYTVSKSVSGAQTSGHPAAGNIQNLEQLMELGRTGKLDANDQHVVNIVDWLLQYAFDQRASDIHLEPRRDMSNVRFRIDGVMHDVYQIPTSVMAAVSSRIKIIGRMDVAEKRRPQDGRLKTRTPEGQEVELRLSTMPTAFGEKLVMRIFDPEVLVRNYRELGFSEADDEIWQTMISQPNGIILVTGPTGSGKTTTLYSTLKQLAKPEVNVCTVEDPIELVEPSFNQMQVQRNIDLDFSAGVRTLMRQDPDIIMIGEMRDLETASNAVQSALTGHLVLSTLHTNDAPSAITRLIDLGVQPFLISSTLTGVVAQRLVRKICPHCEEAYRMRVADLAPLPLGKNPEKEVELKMGKGCLQCRNTGYLGRTGIFEVLPMSEKLGKLTNRKAPLAELQEVALEEGILTLQQSAVDKMLRGVTTFEEVVRVTMGDGRTT